MAVVGMCVIHVFRSMDIDRRAVCSGKRKVRMMMMMARCDRNSSSLRRVNYR